MAFDRFLIYCARMGFGGLQPGLGCKTGLEAPSYGVLIVSREIWTFDPNLETLTDWY